MEALSIRGTNFEGIFAQAALFPLPLPHFHFYVLLLPTSSSWQSLALIFCAVTYEILLVGDFWSWLS